MICGLLINLAHAAFMKNVPEEITQPNGKVVNVFATGDEYYHWLHDGDNYTIVQNDETGYFVYATKNSEGQLVPTSLIVGESNPAGAGLVPGINLEGEQLEEKIAESPLKQSASSGSKLAHGPHNAFTSNFMNQLVIFISFSDSPAFVKTPTFFDDNFNAQGSKSVRDFFDDMSGGAIDVTASFLPTQTGSTVISYQDTHARSFFLKHNATTNPNGYIGSQRTTREHNLLRDAIEFVDDQVDPSLDLDADNDGRIDNIVFIIQGGSAGWADLLWPHRWSLFSHDLEINGDEVDDYNFTLENNGAGVGVLSHELFHTFGAPDLYRYTDNTITPTGTWDLMSSGNWSTPMHTNTYYKKKFADWGPEITEITQAGTYTLESISDNPFAAFKIALPNATNQFLLLEYRKKEGLYESALPGEGLAIFRINESANGNASTTSTNGLNDEVYIFRPNGSLTTNGFLSSAGFSSTNSRTEFNDNTNPDAFLSDGSAAGLGSFGISNVTAIGNTISFDYTPNTGGGDPSEILGPDCLSQNGVGVYTVNPDTLNAKPTAVAVNWWYNGSKQSLIQNPNDNTEVTLSAGSNFSSADICVLLNYQQAPWNDLWCKNIGICGSSKLNEEDLQTAQVSVSPNPVVHSVRVSGIEDVTEVVVSNLAGVPQTGVSYSVENDGSLSIDMSTLITGSYIISVTSEENSNVFSVIKN